MDAHTRQSNDIVCAAVPARLIGKKTWDKWHHIFRHISMKSIMALKKHNMVASMTVNESKSPSEQCEAYIQAKHTTAPFPKKSETETAQIGDLTVMDLCGPASVRKIRGEHYFVMFTDAKACYSDMTFCKYKSEATTLFKAYNAGGEYVNDDFWDSLCKHRIGIDMATLELPAQNSITEHLNSTLMDHAMTIIIAAGLPKFLWPDAVEHITYLKNRSPTCGLVGITPVKAWTGKKPDIANLQEWGAKCWVLISQIKQTKLDLKFHMMHFFEMADGSKAWKHYNPTSQCIGKLQNLVFAIPNHTSSSVPEPTKGEYDFVELPAPALLERESSTDGEQATGGDLHPEQPRPSPPITPKAASFSQAPRLDYFKTFAPVICMDLLRLLLTIAAKRDMELAQFDGIGAYLNADLDEEIYMQQPPRYEEGSSPVVWLHKALYRLKQAGRQWNHHINKVLTSNLGFQWLNSNWYVYLKKSPKVLTIIKMHVDDMIMALHVIKQSQYIQTILGRFKMTNCNPVPMLLDPNVKLCKEPEDANLTKMRGVPYQTLIGSLMYAVLGTRPDISYAPLPDQLTGQL
ncbi:hypothetical protein NUW54_g585 [Trametes sanguinea]|uniref:Uncharacterized protein n=1 Tax=Trametes sanguinea TaxID=158606 RepID=A0ACC1Q8S5_9APHY|nr:hypothetical protein NUW54_g585 [Trametes sanguinea]